MTLRRITLRIDEKLYKKFQKIVGKGNVSKRTRELFKDYIESF